MTAHDESAAPVGDALDAALAHAAHVLPAQGPIGVFIHHNTLHAYQHLPFHEAIAAASAELGVSGYLPESEYRRHRQRGRIARRDLEAVLARRAAAQAADAAAPLSRARIKRISVLFGVPEEEPVFIRWQLAELGATHKLRADVPDELREALAMRTEDWLLEADGTDEVAQSVVETLGLRSVEALRAAFTADRGRVTAEALWAACRGRTYPARPLDAADVAARTGKDRTHRDLLRAATGEDAADLVDPLLVRFCAAYLDEGMAHWSMPPELRDQGMWPAFVALYSQRGAPHPVWMRGLAAELVQHAAAGRTAREVVGLALEELGVPRDSCTNYVVRVLLALPGWAGMVSRLEQLPSDRGPDAPAASLLDYLAIRLVLSRYALRDIAERRLGYTGPLSGLRGLVTRMVRDAARAPGRAEEDALAQAWRLFHLAQLDGVAAPDVVALNDVDVARVIAELDRFDSLERRKLFHEAYEAHHRDEVLAGLAANLERPLEQRIAAAPSVQVLCCFDDREESFRRALEETDPSIATYGLGGFFGFAMDYRGLDEGQAAPRCPVLLTPGHIVTEVAHPDHVDAANARQRRRTQWARLKRDMSSGTRSLVRGLLLVPVFGALAFVGLLGRILFPRAYGSASARLLRRLLPEPLTVLTARREEEAVFDGLKASGFTVREQADRVAAQLENTGLLSGFARLIVLLGHGSSSVNNPHRSAYDCGACGGRHGDASARLFAEAANRPEVRVLLRQRGIDLPDSVWFIGGMHDTASDAIRLADLDQVPETFRADLARIVATLDTVRALSAQERCRRLESAPRDPSPRRALAHVEARAQDLGEPRPELGHVTNAVCVIGRRAMTRGLFLDRRAFVISYDASTDPHGSVLERLLVAVGPVGAGINLEYYFSCVDNERLGAGTKLPHNLVALLGVMDGAMSDLRTGLPKQMIEIHEPVRLLLAIEAETAHLLGICERREDVRELVVNGWVRLVAVHPETGHMMLFEDGAFVPYEPPKLKVPVVASSHAWYRGQADSLPPAIIDASVAKKVHRAVAA